MDGEVHYDNSYTAKGAAEGVNYTENNMSTNQILV